MALQASRILLEVFISIPLGQSSTPQSVKKTIQRLLTQRKPVELIEKDLYEMHIKGSGPGGQAVNKTNNAVCLVHKPTGIQVRSHKTRYLEINRRDARKRLKSELDKHINGNASQEAIAALRDRERKRLASKQMARNARKCERDEAAQKAIEKGNPEMARIYATNAIRKRNEALNYLRMSARFDAVASQIGSAVTSGMVSKTMNTVVKGLDQALQSDNVEKISMMMDQFESQCGVLNTQSAYMDTTMSATSQLTTPVDQVDELIQQVGDAHGLDVKMALRSSEVPMGSPLMQASAVDQNDELTQRLNALRGG